jgi:hypothetical protein
MITKEELINISKKTGLNLYQQEKDYLLKLFLSIYYRKYEDAIFKGGTCLKYLFGLPRFSEDLDFNISINPKKYKSQVESTVRKINLIGIKTNFKKLQMFKDSFTCEIKFEGPLYIGKEESTNKVRIDAGRRTGTLLEPEWQLISSEYPETTQNFLVLAMNEKEMLAEKTACLFLRKKGRDLYDVWFLSKRGVKANRSLLIKKVGIDFSGSGISLSKKEYERDMKRLTNQIVPYKQALAEAKKICGLQ